MKDLPTIISDLKKLTEGKPWGLMDRVQAYIKVLESEKGKPKQRTATQNNSLHLWLSLIADELNNQGQTLQNVVAKIRRAEIRPTTNSLKEAVWRPYQMAAIHDEKGNPKESTTQLTKNEVTIVYEGLNKFFSQEFGIGIPFPSQEVNQENYYQKADQIKIK